MTAVLDAGCLVPARGRFEVDLSCYRYRFAQPSLHTLPAQHTFTTTSTSASFFGHTFSRLDYWSILQLFSIAEIMIVLNITTPETNLLGLHRVGFCVITYPASLGTGAAFRIARSLFRDVGSVY
jgi:hypothetical protein